MGSNNVGIAGWLWTSVALAGLSAGCKHFQPEKKIAMAQTMSVENIMGAWELTIFDVQSGDENKKGWADEFSGLLIYSHDGYMSVAIDGKVHATTIAELVEVKSFSYCGRFELIDGAVVHQVTHASDRQRIGQRLQRQATLVGNFLTLVSQGNEQTATLVWRRLP